MYTDDIFKALELKHCREKREMLKKDNVACKAAEVIEKDTLVVLEDVGANPEKKLKKVKLQSLLLFYGVEKKEVTRMKAPKRVQNYVSHDCPLADIFIFIF